VPSPDDIADQQEILAAHRATLAEFLKQQALLGVAYAPPGIANGIRLSRDAIKQIKATLREWGVEVENHPDDEALPQAISASASEQASLGLRAMADLISAPDVRARVEAFQDSFGIACRQIDRLSNYKDLHDLLHDLQFNCYNPIMRGAKDFPDNALFLESLEDYTAELQQIINGLWEVAERAVFSTNEQAWIRQFSPTTQLLRSAIEQSSKVLLERATFQIGRVLFVHPTRINERLKETARELHCPR
jgi:biotin operon repressor